MEVLENQVYRYVHYGELTVRMQGTVDEVTEASRKLLEDNNFYGLAPSFDFPVVEDAPDQDVLRKIGANGTPEFIGRVTRTSEKPTVLKIGETVIQEELFPHIPRLSPPAPIT